MDWQTLLLYGTLSALGLWAALVVASRVYYFRVTRGRRSARPFNVVPYPTREQAREAAQRRREILAEFLGREGESRSSAEFLEGPEGRVEGGFRFGGFGPSDSEESAGPWRRARYVLQLRRDQDLLIERVIDHLVAQARERGFGRALYPTCVRLEPLPFWLRRSRFPWRVVIQTPEPDPLVEIFGSPRVLAWLGIGVDVLPLRGRSEGRGFSRPSAPEPEPDGPNTSPQVLVPFGRCQVGDDGLDGVVGGLIRLGDRSALGVTCRHVVSSSCKEIRWPMPIKPTNGEFTQDSPDAAFVDPSGPCFTRSVSSGVSVPWVGQEEITTAARRGSAVVKEPGDPQRLGVVTMGTVQGVTLGDYFYRGYHFQISPRFTQRLGIYFPLAHHFSVPGDSGAWVFDAETRAWMGMIVGGFAPPNDNISVALAAEYILLACQTSGQFPSPLIPETLV